MDKSTIWAAWIGATTGLCSFVWNVYLKFTSGPKLSIGAHAGMVSMPPMPGNPRILRIVVRNVGTAPTTITNYSFHSFKGLRSRFRKTEFNAVKSAVLNQYRGTQCPTKLDVGEEVNVFMDHDAEFEEWLKEGLWVGVSHSFGHGAQLAKVYVGGKKIGHPKEPK
jgi:hypothetical protein